MLKKKTFQQNGLKQLISSHRWPVEWMTPLEIDVCVDGQHQPTLKKSYGFTIAIHMCFVSFGNRANNIWRAYWENGHGSCFRGDYFHRFKKMNNAEQINRDSFRPSASTGINSRILLLLAFVIAGLLIDTRINLWRRNSIYHASKKNSSYNRYIRPSTMI